MGVFRDRSRVRTGASDDGATIVEFVLFFPILMLVVFAIFQFGWMGYAFAEVWTASREGAQQAVTLSSVGEIDKLGTCQSVYDAIKSRTALNDLDETQTTPFREIEITYYSRTSPSDPSPTAVANCQDGAATQPEELGCDPTATGACPVDPFDGIFVEVTVKKDYNAISVPLLGPILDSLILQSTQERSVQTGRLIEPAPPTSSTVAP